MRKLTALIIILFAGLQSCIEINPLIDNPSFILFITDDISFNDLACYGNTAISTPNIDMLAEEGLVFDNFYLTASSCSPSRCSIITGRYPHNTGAPELHTTLPEDQIMFPTLLRKAGYYTALSGKNHMGDAVRAAFDTISTGQGPGAEEDWVELIKNRPKDKPFFFWFASNDAHRSWDIDEYGKEYDSDDVIVPPMLYDGPATREDLTGYYHEITRTDYYLGRLVDILDRQNMLEDTYIIYMSDNGRPFPRCKVRLYDSGIKTPFIISGPGIPEGTSTHALASSVDIAATVLKLAGLNIPESVMGVDQTLTLTKPYLKSRDMVFAEHNWHVFAAHERMIRYSDWVYIRNNRPDKMNMSVESAKQYPAGAELWSAWAEGFTTDKQEDIFLVPRPSEELYNMETDPFQFNNLAGEDSYTEILDFLRQALDQWAEDTKDNIPADPTPDRQDVDAIRNPDFERKEMPGILSGAAYVNTTGPVNKKDIIIH